MGNGPLQQGIGYGDATVWNPNQAVQNFGNLLQQQKQKDEADANAVATELSKVKSDGLRNDADRQYFLNKYNEIKNNAISGLNERNSVKRALAQAQTRDALMGLQQYVARSKAQGAAEHSFGQQYLSNPTPWADSAIEGYRKSIAAPLDSPDVIKDFTTQQRVVDHAKVDAAMKKMHDAALKQTPWSNPIQTGGVVTQGNKKGVITYQQRQLPADQILANDAHLYDVDRNVQHSINQRYSAINGATPDETKMLRIRQAAIDRGDIAEGPNGQIISKVVGEQNRKFNPDRAPDNYYAHFNFREANSPNSLQTPAQTLIAGDPSRGIAGMQQGGIGTGEKFINLAPAYQYGGKKPAIGIDENTGEHVFTFPAQVTEDKTAKAKNAKIRADYESNPDKVGGILGFGAKTIPFEKSSAAKTLLPEQSVKKPQQIYRVNPNSPDYLSKIAEIAKEQNINLSQLNQIEGKKASRGQIDQAVHNSGVNPVNKHKKSATDYGL